MDAPNTIPSQVVSIKGRKAFCHSRWIPFIAPAVAEQKRLVTAVDVAWAASENIVTLYRRGIAERARIAVVEARERRAECLAAAQKLLELEEEEQQKQAAGGVCAAGVDDEESELEMQQLLEEMAATTVITCVQYILEDAVIVSTGSSMICAKGDR